MPILGFSDATTLYKLCVGALEVLFIYLSIYPLYTANSGRGLRRRPHTSGAYYNTEVEIES
jgi:hypothetical protein